MAVDKFSGQTPTFMQILSSRVSLEDALSRFEEAVSLQEPSTLRKRLRKRLADVRVNIHRGGDEADEA